jgi:hypothetical protein
MRPQTGVLLGVSCRRKGKAGDTWGPLSLGSYNRGRHWGVGTRLRRLHKIAQECRLFQSRRMAANVRRRAAKVLPIAAGVRWIVVKVRRTAHFRRIDVRRMAKVGGVGNCHSGLF